MRAYLDPLEGLERQLEEFKGFASIVPKLVATDRERRWNEIAKRPAPTGERELVEVYEEKSGPEEGWGWADFERIALASALALSWELFREFLVGEFMEHMNAWVEGTPEQVKQLRDEEESKLSRDFNHLRRRYATMLNIPLTAENIPRWVEVEDIQLVRHAIVHNQGFYTNTYARRPNARPPRENAFGLRPAPDQWINREIIPVDLEYVTDSLDLLLATARHIRRQLEQS